MHFPLNTFAVIKTRTQRKQTQENCYNVSFSTPPIPNPFSSCRHLFFILQCKYDHDQLSHIWKNISTLLAQWGIFKFVPSVFVTLHSPRLPSYSCHPKDAVSVRAVSHRDPTHVRGFICRGRLSVCPGRFLSSWLQPLATAINTAAVVTSKSFSRHPKIFSE